MNKVAKVIAHRVVNSALIAGCFVAPFHFIPMEIDIVNPVGGAGQAQVVKNDYDKAMSKCKTLPAGEFPTSVVIEWKNGETVFSKSPGDANYLFKVAVGEMDLNPQMNSFTLCK